MSATVLRLRRLLGDNDMIFQQGGKLWIDARKCWVDVWTFERRLAPMDGALPTDNKVVERALGLYQGSFLPDDPDAAFAILTRERVRAKFVHALGYLGRHLESQERYENAVYWYLRGLDADAVIEPFYQGLMRCYAALDRNTEAIAAYRRLRQTLSVVLGLQPSISTEKLYQALRQSR